MCGCERMLRLVLIHGRKAGVMLKGEALQARVEEGQQR